MRCLIASLLLASFGCEAVVTEPLPRSIGSRSVPAKVVSITDGDTLTVLVDKEQRKIRLEGIDAPEKRRSQPFWRKSKERLGDLCRGKTIRYVENDRDRWGRIIATVFAGDQDVSEQLLLDGMAWHYKKYNKDPKYAAAERMARSSKKGLWSDPKPVPPWDWRKPRQQADQPGPTD